MDRELIFKKIDNIIETRKNLWTTAIVLTGGLSGLLLSMLDFNFGLSYIIKILLFLLGFIMNIFFVINLSDCNKNINYLLNKLEKG